MRKGGRRLCVDNARLRDYANAMTAFVVATG